MHIRRRWLALAHAAWLVSAALAFLVFLAAIPLGYALRFSGALIGPPVDAPAWYVALVSFAQGVVSVLAALVSLALAGVIFWKKRDDPMALFVSFYLLAHGIISAGPLEALNGFSPLIPGAPTHSGMLISPELISGMQAGVFTVLGLWLFYLFPSGRFVPSWTRHATLLALLLAPAQAYIFAREWTSAMTPLAWFIVGTYTVLLGAGVYAQIYRYRRVATPVERQQSKWVVFGMILNLFIVTVLSIPYATLSQIPAGIVLAWWVPLGGLGWWVSVTIVPLSLAIAVMRYRLWDIDLIAKRALVYALLTASVVAIYVLLLVILGAMFHTSGNLLISLLATALVAVLFQPLRERLQRGVNRLMFGERDDPYVVLSRLGQRLEATLAAEAVLPTIVETVAQALKLSYAGIALKEGDEFQVAAEYPSPRSSISPNTGGEPPTPSPASRDTVEVIPLTYQSEVIGQLMLTSRATGESFTVADHRLLEHFAHQAGVAAYGVRLTRELQRSRGRLVVAREEERRRIRRDLHDGLGPALAAQMLKVGAARTVLAQNPLAADAVLAVLESDIEKALADIRRLVYALRPPELDQLGLIGAIRETAVQYSVRDGAQLAGVDRNRPDIRLDVPKRLPPLPAAVEVAAYRIVQEALTNVIRHAHASTCCLQLWLDGSLRITVSDDGLGLHAASKPGVGLTSMRERATELGGTCVIEPATGGGTRIHVQLPLVLPTVEDG